MFGHNDISRALKPTACNRNNLREQYRQFTGRKVLFFLFLTVAIALLAGVAVILGSAEISIMDVYVCTLAGLFPGHFHTTAFADMIVWDLRLDRVLMGIVDGMGLGVSGDVMQGILKNPLACPFTLGISSAAGFGAALAIILGAGIAAGSWLVFGNAFIFALLSSLAVYGLAKYKGISSETMILAGIAIIDLVAPHITRMAIGGDHRFLLPGSAQVGALLLLGADTLARVVLAPAILPEDILVRIINKGSLICTGI
jgi:ABC-type Fe3+-siderophore transport system permease subunit